MYYKSNILLHRVCEAIAKNSMVPFPDLYKGREVAMGGSVAAHTNAGPTYPPRASNNISYGTKHGYSSSPPPMDLGLPNRPAYNIDDIPPTDSDILLDLRQLINAIHTEQEVEHKKTQD